MRLLSIGRIFSVLEDDLRDVRARRSSFQTVRLSPSFKALRQRASAGRFVVAPGSRSVKVFLQPARCNALSCMSGFWSMLANFLTRKGAHLTEYAILCMLLVLGPMRRHPLLAVLICAGYAATDEFHQIFVPGRTPALHDIALDSVGAFCACLAWPVLGLMLSA